ncbi:hypothetical protein APHCR_0758 [Anaplasma phagocytophilum str. CR1007]|nr:hypothetical protein APHCR_0758 [Anaplasma phagocytophilum str. CR1007]
MKGGLYILIHVVLFVPRDGLWLYVRQNKKSVVENLCDELTWG